MNSTMARLVFVHFSICLSIQGVDAGESETRIAELIDRHVNEQLAEAGVAPAERLGDAAFARRVFLDLAGRIPTRQECQDFKQLEPANKRRELVDRLLESPDFAFQLRNELDMMLLARKTHNDAWREYLLAACRENRPWDQLLREILLPEYMLPEQPGPAAFLRERAPDLDELTNETSTLLFGVNIACAKCHDHPLVSDWEQQHYFGMAMFFKRTYRTRNGLVAERPEGQMKFVNIIDEEMQAEFMFLTGAKVDEPEGTLPKEELKRIEELVRKAEKDDNAELPPLPEFSPRKRFVELAIDSAGDNAGELASDTAEANYFARNIVNRTWARLMGRGLVHPLDQMHPENRPSHPELLDALASDFAEHGKDLRRLIRGIVLSDAYQRSSQWAGGQALPEPALYAVAVPRPLSPWQLSLSLIVASRNPELMPGLGKPDDWERQRQQFESHANGMARRLEIPDDGFQVSAEEALYFSNSPQVESDYLRDAGDGLVGHLKTLEDPESLVRTAFDTVLTRSPNLEEQQAVTRYLDAREDRRVESLRQVVWALMSSPEFRFNH